MKLSRPISINKQSNTLTSFFHRLLFLSLFTPTIALADGETPVAGGLNYIITAMTGATGMAIATIAVIAVGLLCLGHYLEWKRLIQTVVGISIIFGAPLIVRGIISLTRSGGM